MGTRPSVAIVLVMAVAGGCRAHAQGDAPAGPGTPSQSGESFTELDAFQHDLDVSEQRLFAELDRKRDSHRFAEAPGAAKAAPADQSDDEKAGADRPAPAAPPPPAAEPAASAPPPATAAEPAAPLSTLGSPCDQACRALASMKRSADGICSIAGEGDERCSAARGRVASGAARVRGAGCACAQRP